MTKSMLEVYESDFKGFSDSSYSDSDGNEWPANYLYEKVEELKLEVEEINIRHINMSFLPWQGGTLESIDCFAYHSVRIQNCDTSIPVIIGQDGVIVDGWHRVVKAILEGKTYLKAFRFETYIPPIGENNVE